MKDAYWFSHDSNAKDDPKIMLMIDQLGLEGYGIYWVLIETLREQPDYRYPLQLLPVLGKRYFTSGEKMKAVVMNYGLFQVQDDEFFFSESLCNRMLKMDSKREKARYAGVKSGAVRALKAKTPNEELSDLPQFYVLRCFNESEEFIKIGCTAGRISRRFSGHLPYEYEVLRQVFSLNYIELEKEFTDVFSDYKTLAKISFSGDAECYNVQAKNKILNYQPVTKFSHEHVLQRCSNKAEHDLSFAEHSKVKNSKVKKSKEQNSKVKDSKVKKNKKSLPHKAADFIDEVVDCFAEVHGDYEVLNRGKERAAAGKLVKTYKKRVPEATSEETIAGLREYFEKCVNIDDAWMHTNMSLPLIVSKFNEINKLLKHGKGKQSVTDKERQDLLSRIQATIHDAEA